ncbi:DNA ligase 4 [Vigna unguiculata]|uniref:DNA ligase 4 n=1 Tax=Vigna unguiculata TaxID=3917 RepID=A0A4D6L1L1_VIGUN|nr:DNA ligase 4 [Vigna unguiculata]
MSASPSFQNTLSILHQVPEGHVGVYWRGGALLKTITEPGFHLKMPFLTQYEPVQVTLQTDQVTDIPCGTKGGVMINFEKIEVVNRLHKEFVFETLLNYGVHYDKTWIYDKIHHEINQFCSSHSLQQVYIDVFDQIDEKMKDALQVDCTRYAPGIEIISVRVTTKPTIPNTIRRNFEQMEEERTKVLIAIEKQKVAEKEAETMKKMAISEAEKNANVSKILMEQKLLEKDSTRRQEEIENAMYLAREKSLADADFYRVIKEAEANTLKLTPEFLQLKFIEAIANNTKIFFGDKSQSAAKKGSKFQKFLSLFPAIRLILPNLDREHDSYGLKESVLATSLIDALGISRYSPDVLRLINWHKGGAVTSDTIENFALVVVEVSARRRLVCFRILLCCDEVKSEMLLVLTQVLHNM